MFHIGEKSLSQTQEDSPPQAKHDWAISPSPIEDVEEGEVGDMGTPPGECLTHQLTLIYAWLPFV